MTRAVLLVLAVAAPASMFASGYTEHAVVHGLLAGAAAASVAVTLALARRLPPVPSLLAGLPVPLLMVLVLASTRPGQTTGALPGAIDALLHSGARILTTIPPAPATVDTLTLPLLGTWLTGTAAALALRADRPLLALLPPVLLLSGAAVLAGPDTPPGYPAVAVLIATGAAMLGLARPEGRPALRTVIPTSVALGALAALAGPPALASWPVRPADPRIVAEPPTDRQEAVNPLSYLPAWAARPDRPLIHVRAERPVELRWVTLSEFTGQTWLPESGYRPAGELLPAPSPPPPRATPRRAALAVSELPGPWLPSVGYPRQVKGLPIAYDPSSGTLVARDGRSSGRGYTLTGDVPDWRAADAARGAVPTDPAFQRYRELPQGAPARIQEIAALVAGTDGAYRQALRLAEHLRRDYTLDRRARGGHGYASLVDFLVMPGEGRRGAGSADQFASAFAVLARAVGLPSRVTIGFGPGRPDASGVRRITTGDAVAWGEIYFDEVGWVPFDVLPGGRTEAGSATAPQGTAAEPAPSSRAAPAPTPTPAPKPPADAGQTTSSDGSTWVPLLLSGAAVAAVGAVPLLRRLRTRRRLTRGGPAERLLGAWAELLDGLRLAGHPVPPAFTAWDVAARHPYAGLEPLAAQINVVGFAAPGDTSVSVHPADAATAVEAVRGFLRALRRSRSRTRRVLWWLDPRPLLW